VIEGVVSTNTVTRISEQDACKKSLVVLDSCMLDGDLKTEDRPYGIFDYSVSISVLQILFIHATINMLTMIGTFILMHNNVMYYRVRPVLTTESVPVHGCAQSRFRILSRQI